MRLEWLFLDPAQLALTHAAILGRHLHSNVDFSVPGNSLLSCT